MSGYSVMDLYGGTNILLAVSWYVIVYYREKNDEKNGMEVKGRNSGGSGREERKAKRQEKKG